MGVGEGPELKLLFAVLQGTSAEQDNRFSNKQKKLLKQLKFAECLEKKVSGVGEWESNPPVSFHWVSGGTEECEECLP